VREVVSLVDVVATMVEAANAPAAGPLAGASLFPLARGDDGAMPWKDEAFAAYLAHGVDRPMAMLRRGRYKLMTSLGEAPELYDLVDDPGEVRNLANDPACTGRYHPIGTRWIWSGECARASANGC
jgi:choline-sulfatase